MPAADLVLKGGTLVSASGRLEADLVIKDGKVLAWTGGELTPSAGEVIDVRGKFLLPGLIDSHVHIRYPGGGERENFASGTRAAAAGGITTVLEHPVSSPSVYSAEIFSDRRRVCEPHAYVDFGLYGSMGSENLDSLDELAEAGAIAFKCFLQDIATPGREEDYFGVTATDEGVMYEMFERVAATGRPAAVHAESNDMVLHGMKKMQAAGRNDIIAHHDSRTVANELVSCATVLEMAKATGARLLVCHVSGGTVVAFLRSARDRGYNVLIETCPHYLFLSLDEAIELGPYAKINPPIRTAEERDHLWRELARGSVDFIGSDHAPFYTEEKEPGWEEIWKAPSGAAGLETTVPLMIDAAVRGRLELEDLVRLMAENTARHFDLWPKKGSLSPGSDGDVVVVDLEGERFVSRETMFTQGAPSALLYDGRTLGGQVLMTIVRGEPIYREGRITGGEGFGELVLPQNP